MSWPIPNIWEQCLDDIFAECAFEGLQWHPTCGAYKYSPETSLRAHPLILHFLRSLHQHPLAMDQFRKIFKLSGQDNHERSLKHCKSMPLRKSKSPKERDGECWMSVRRTKEPLKSSRLDGREQMHGVLVTQRQRSYGDGLHGSFVDLLDKFPDPPGPPPRPPRNPLRATSLNNTSYITDPAPSHPTPAKKPSSVSQSPRSQRRKFAIHHATPISNPDWERDLVVPENVMLGSVIPRRMARDRVHTEAQVHGNDLNHPASYSTSGKGRGSRSRDAPFAGRMDFGFERERARKWIAESPVAPPIYEDMPCNLRPVRFDMRNSKCVEVGLDYHAQLAAGTGRPLDARYDGHYHRLLDESFPKGLVPEVGRNWSEDVLPGPVCPCTTGRW